ALEELCRLLHTTKGSALTLGFRSLGHVAGLGESALEDLAAGGLQWTPAFERTISGAVGCLEQLAAGATRGEFDQRPMVAAAIRSFRRFRGLSESGDAEEIEAALAAPAAVGPAVRDEIPPDVLETFRQEADEHLQSIGELLRRLSHEPDRGRFLSEVRRGVHTLKGSAASVGLSEVSRLAHRLEDLLDRLSQGTLALSGDVQSLLFATFDAIEDMIGDSPIGAAAPVRCESIYVRYAALLNDDAPAAAALAQAPTSAGSSPQDGAAPLPKPSDFVRVPVKRLDELVRLASELVVSRASYEQSLAASRNHLTELEFSIERLKKGSAGLSATEPPAQSGGARGKKSPLTPAPEPSRVRNGKLKHADFDSLEFDRYTALNLSVHNVNETTADLAAVSAELGGDAGDFDSHLARLERLTRDIQDRLMQLRTVPLHSIATRLHRAVRVTSEFRGKPASLSIEGEQIEFDKTMLDEIEGALEHILRNAIDHGIESADSRRASGKPPAGQIVLRACYEGTQIVIRVSDDGMGLNVDRLRAESIRRGYYTEHEARVASRQDLLDLIFEPGFSTAAEVSEVSGRGLGLEAARAAVSRLRGVISVETQPGSRTEFTLRLPLTLAVQRVLMVRASGETFAIPLAAISQVLRVDPASFERLGRKPVIRIHGRVVPVLRLNEALDLPDPPDPTVLTPPAVVLQMGSLQAAVLVDSVLQARDAVVKSLGSVVTRTPGISGATLTGDGSVVLIVNPAELIAETEEQARAPRAPARQPARAAAQIEVLLVDDSVSVRRVLSNLLRDRGWVPVAAKDGLEALEMLRRGKRPDAVLLDVEMPRMDGFELTAALRRQEAFKDLPIIMLTSRSGSKHRSKAMELGVTEYFGKPFQNDALLAAIERAVDAARGTAA
ncbi:MAG: hybrid sensor histidine kinase/response regulator, partial [Bryobacteraceae bacterium]